MDDLFKLTMDGKEIVKTISDNEQEAIYCCKVKNHWMGAAVVFNKIKDEVVAVSNIDWDDTNGVQKAVRLATEAIQWGNGGRSL